MSIALRVILFAVSSMTLMYMVRKIRKSQLKIEYSLFWIVFSGVLVVLSIFPSIAVGFANTLGLYSPTNLLFLVIIFILVVKLFRLTIDMSKMDDKIEKLVQHQALYEYEEKVNDNDK